MILFSRVEIHPKKWGWKINIEKMLGYLGNLPMFDHHVWLREIHK